MNKTFTRYFLSFLLFSVLALPSVLAQTITLGTVDPGPYGQGSTVTVPFHVNDAGGCISTNNVFSLYMSDASGNFVSSIPVDTIRTFYGTFMNFTIPNGTPAGTGYRFRVTSSGPAVTSGFSNKVTIDGNGGVTTSAGSQSIGSGANPEVYGSCSGAANASYVFTDQSTAGSTVTASFFNEGSQTTEVASASLATPYNFSANTSNYTVTVKAVNGSGEVGTYSYQLINNVVNSTFGSTGNPSVCLSGGTAAITYNVDYQSPNGIQYNYPGNVYVVSWGDGTPLNTYTYCQIAANNGKVNHIFKKASCGITSNNQPNSFDIDFTVKNTYCGQVGPVTTSYAKVFVAPANAFTGPLVSCTGNTLSFTNISNPGPDPNATTSSCNDNPNALWTWSVDGAIIKANYKKSQVFSYPFGNAGTHSITLHLQNGAGPCVPNDTTVYICIQNPPQPNFDIPVKTYCIASGSQIVTPVNTSVIDSNCDRNNKFTWTVNNLSGASAGITYANGTTANSKIPQFVFSKVGIYVVSMSVSTLSCNTVPAPQTDTIVVNSTPSATLSADYSVCGVGHTLVFDATANSPTYTNLTGTAQTLATTYTWAVTGGNFQYAAGYSANSKYPHITFLDAATYTVTVTQQNNCSTVTSAPQHIIFSIAPTVVAGNDTTICQGAFAALNGSIKGNTNSFQWMGGSGTFSPGRNSLKTNYTPSAAEIKAGTVQLALLAVTSVTKPCDSIYSNINITIVPTDSVTSAPAATICSGTQLNYTITATNSSSTYTWTSAVTAGSASGNTSGTGNTISDILTNTNTGVTAVITYTITAISNGCAGSTFAYTITIPATPAITAVPTSTNICTNQPVNINLTSNQAATTYTWTSVVSSPNLSGNSNQGAATSTTEIQDIMANNGTVPATVTYTIMPYNSNNCAGVPVTASVTVQPLPIVANAGADTTLCDPLSYQLQGNAPYPGHGKWTDISGKGAVFANDTLYNTVVNGLVGGKIYNLQWAISTGPGCQSANSVIITINAQTVPGTTSTTDSSTVCAGSNSGQIDLSGQTGMVINWERSTDNGATWKANANPNTTATQTFLNLITTTQFRAVIQNGVCPVVRSSITTITVNQPVLQADAGNDQTLCSVITTTLTGNDPGVFAAAWRQTSGPAATIVDSTKSQTAVNGLIPGNVYTFIWIIKGLPPCADSQSQVTVTDNVDVIASFTDNKKLTCGNQTVQFNNTSNSQATASFLWDFGDGTSQSTAISPQHTFIPRTDGRDTTYAVSLSILNNCAPRPAVIDSILVRPASPISKILPNQTTACGNFTLIVQNESPGNNVSYDFYLYLGSALIQHINKTDKSAATFNPLSTTKSTQFTLYMVATNYCGTTTESTHIPITITPPTFVPQTFATNNVTQGCAPFTATFTNNSSGGDVFYYNIYDANHQLIDRPAAGTADFSYTFTTPGTFYVTITASNSCGARESDPPIQITVYDLPAPDFSAANTTGCKDLVINFTNLTPDPNTTLSYEWDFGDNSAHVFAKTPPPHSYHYTNSPYTVTLTATNTGTSCVSTIVKTSYITVNSPPLAAFTEKPDSVISIPDYHFSFLDQTPGAVSWQWSFSDGQSSTNQNPEITFPDTGFYKATLTATNRSGCDSTVTHIVRITGIPGQLYLPNAFIPTSGTSAVKLFMPKGSGIKTFLLQVFNGYGQLVWQTTKLDAKGVPLEGWDGTYKGSPAQQGVYFWQASASFINGTSWKGMSYNNSLPKRSGSVTLIR